METSKNNRFFDSAQKSDSKKISNKEEKIREELTEEELDKYADEFWDKGYFAQTISSEELEQKKKTIGKSHNEDMNFNCKKCNKKISIHNKDWHDNMCDDCFNKNYFPDTQLEK